MAEREVQVPLGDRMVDGFDIPIRDSSEKWSEFELEDGTIIRAKVNLISAVRVKDQHDQAGNPVYVISAAPVVGVVNVSKGPRKNA